MHLSWMISHKEEGIKVVNIFNLFVELIEDFMNSVIDAETCSHQILYIPNIPIFSYFLNPALCVVKNFMFKEESFFRSKSSTNETFNR